MRETTVEELCTMVRQGSGLCVDSRKVQPGDIFVAVQGTHHDGSCFISAALRAGAVAVVGHATAAEALSKVDAAEALSKVDAAEALKLDATEQAKSCELLFARVDDPVQALGQLAQARYNTADVPFPVFGVTGTNGKTTVSYLLEHVFSACGTACGVLGTVSYRWPGHESLADMTTPDTLATHAMLASMRDAGVGAAFMELSSHALDQNRIAGLRFAGGIFTNLTQDHLDYHATMESYFAAKARLFSDLSHNAAGTAGGLMAVNADDPWGRRLLAAFPQAIAYGLNDPTHDEYEAAAALSAHPCLRAQVLENAPSGLHLAMQWQDGATQREWEIRSPLIGVFNAQNLLAVQALALGYGLSPEHFDCFTSFYGVPGRLERVPAMREGRELHVFVDYAHTPDALENVLHTLRGVGFARIVTVFGCGGDRDKTKRPRMGEAVARLSDVAVLSSDNPRHEDPLAIIADVLVGMAEAATVVTEPDRRAAIALALGLLNPGDVLLIAGKGHEQTQQIGDVKHPFSDQQIVRELAPCV